VEYLKSLVNNQEIEFRTIYGMEPSPDSLTDGSGWESLKSAITQTWPDTLISPYLMYACSDSRHYCRISDRVYRFSAMKLSKEERAMIHGHNERIPLETLGKIIQFYTRLMRRA